MTRRRLIHLNAALIVALGGLTVASVAGAGRSQPPAGGDRPGGEYTMVSGRVQGSTTHGVYILDATNQEVIALSWDRNNNRFSGIGYRSLIADGRSQPSGR